MSERLWHILVDSFPKILLPGLKMTIPLTVIAFALAMVIATVVALIQFAHVKVLTQVARFYIWVIRGTPLLVQLFVVYYGLPKVGIVMEAFPAAVLVFSINEGAYCAETMRGALESVPAGQIEAGYCAGLSFVQVMRRIVLPQALRTAFPPLSNSLISMVKDTSLAANITVTEMFMATQRVVARTYEPLALYLEVALIYLIFSTALTWLQRFIFLLLTGTCMVLIWTALYMSYTPVGAPYIAGVQPRYYLPLLLPVFAIFFTDRLKPQKGGKWITAACLGAASAVTLWTAWACIYVPFAR